jgi:ankyrin repeat protein
MSLARAVLVGLCCIAAMSGGCTRRSIHSKVIVGDLSAVRQYLQRGGDPNCPNTYGATLLHDAVQAGNLPMVELLLDSGAYIDAEDSSGYTPLHALCFRRGLERYQIANLLVLKGASTNAKTKIGWTVLHSAAMSGKRDVIKLLVDHGADPNAKTTSGTTPLHVAVQERSAGAAAELVKAGADVLAVDSIQVTPVDYAIMGKDTAMARLLVQGIDLRKGDEYGYTALHEAVRLGKTELVKLLIERKVDVNQETNDGWTSLDFALNAHSRNQAMVDLLVAAGAHTGKGAEYKVASEKDAGSVLDRAREAIRNGKDINERDSAGRTLLSEACMRADAEACAFLLANRAKVDTIDRVGLSPLHYASPARNPALVKSLIDAGADPDCDSIAGTPIHMVVGMSDANSVAVFKLMVPKVKDWNRKMPSGSGGSSYVHIAAGSGNDEGLRILIEHGANVNLRNAAGETPLHVAVRQKCKTAIEVLLKAGAEVNAKDGSDLTPLDRATAPDGSKEIAELLRKHGGVVTVSWTQGR